MQPDFIGVHGYSYVALTHTFLHVEMHKNIQYELMDNI